MNPKKPRKNCLSCGEECNRPLAVYCSLKCQKEYQTKKRVEADNFSPRAAKRYLLKIDSSCSICKISSWMDDPIVLEIDHIDGNFENNSLSNFRLICPNCHSQTSTYKNRNKGKGRHSRRIRYKEGKSY